MEIDMDNINTDEKTIDKIKKSLDNSMENEYFVSIVLKMKAKSRNQILEKIDLMLLNSGYNEGFEYIAWRYDGVEE
ncbi:MAG: hypothetical protein LN408_03325 [Candidatus Thermoplasmatota archaeon]|nr:hypothetical protein [Candidatus Thermoplasmatota archaeon]